MAMKKPSRLRDVSGTTLALTSLAVFGAAALASTPLWLYYRRKRRRTDVLVSSAPAGAEPPAPAPDATSER
jgi:hypothetical protein